MWRWVGTGAVVFAIISGCGSSTHNDSPGAASAGGGVTSTAGASSSAASGAGSGNASGGMSGAGGTAKPIELPDLCPIFTRDLCIYLMQCQGARYKDADHCERELTCYGLPQLTAAAESGAVDYDPSQVGACHERFLSSPCHFGVFFGTPDIYEVLQWCPGTITPKLAAGAACSSSGECQGDLFCNLGADHSCPGKCQAPATLGQSCSDGVQCAADLRCENEVCAPRQKAGDPCEGSCNSSVSCPAGEVCPGNLWCDNGVAQCQLGRLEGEPCGLTGSAPKASTAKCAVPLWCDAVGNTAGKCRKMGAEGSPCVPDSFACPNGLHCVGYVADGAGAQLGSCQPPGGAGTDCESAPDCQAGTACVNQKCVVPAGEGAKCSGNDACASGLVCKDGQCAPARYPGDSCDGASCAFGRCVAGTCQYHAQVGETCTTGADCATSQCVDGVCYDSSVCRAPKP